MASQKHCQEWRGNIGSKFVFFGMAPSLSTLRKTEVKATLAYCAFTKPVLVSLCSSFLSSMKLVAHSVSRLPDEDIKNVKFSLGTLPLFLLWVAVQGRAKFQAFWFFSVFTYCRGRLGFNLLTIASFMLSPSLNIQQVIKFPPATLMLEPNNFCFMRKKIFKKDILSWFGEDKR